MASSGNYRNVRTDSAGNVYGHTIDPVSGMPVQTDVLAATVVKQTADFADALATACMTMPAADAIAAMLEACETLACSLSAPATLLPQSSPQISGVGIRPKNRLSHDTRQS